MAKLYFYYGAMGSSKTATALMTQFNYKERGQNPLLLKSGVDTRDGVLKIRSRVGLEADCMTVEQFEDLANNGDCNPADYDVIIVDEAQFCTAEQIDFLSDLVDFGKIPVICYGLRSDFQQNLFEGSKRLLAIADEIHELKTMCWCGSKATCNARIVDGKITDRGEQIMLGANENYVPLCRKHFKTKQLSENDLPWWEW